MRIGPTAVPSIPSSRLAASLALAFLALTLLAGAVRANELVYPTGSRIGLIPLQGVVAVKDGMGFENPDNNLTVTLRELPASAFDAVDTAIKERKSVPTAMENAESFQTAAGRAYLSRAGGPNSGPKNNRVAILVSDGKIAGYVAVDIPEAAAKAYPDQAIRQMLASTTIRTEIPAAEQLSLLPFKVSDLSGFKTVKTLVPGQAVILLDSDDEEAALAGSPYMLISIARISADQPNERDRIARQLANTIPGLREGRITSSEPMRIGGTAGYETRIEATSVKDDKPVTVVQWLRFGGGATLRIVAASARESWPEAFTRFRAVRDGINPR
ncbi:signal peptide protein [Afipia sp. P52-10]|jgi:hypothetical protein|uniref:hypothetical protein n=1 Tax=Afipia sp. P52-10 TaxID=1429916 RepID=UPI0003DF3034|nr:hypothetical protein [Afipia sp. P52-10]ETR77730.1 signal peptide protein [Afipia sp. P52-10]